MGRDRPITPSGILGVHVNDWTLTGVMTLESGTPVAVTQAPTTVCGASLMTIDAPTIFGSRLKRQIA